MTRSPARSRPGKFYRLRAEYEREILQAAVLTHPTHTAAARELGLTRTYFLRLMAQLGVTPKRPART